MNGESCQRIARWAQAVQWVLVVALAVGGQACQSQSTPEPQIGSESSFLRVCEQDSDCGDEGLTCICGACTTSCVTDTTCSQYQADALCDLTPCTPPETPRACVARCVGDEDCAELGTGFSCVEGRCKDQTPAPASREPTLELEELCQAFREDACAIKTHCFDWSYASTEHCLADTDCLDYQALTNALAAGRITYDAAKAYGCHRQIIENTCSFWFSWSVPTVTESLASCGAVTGLVPVGEACAVDAECVVGSACIYTTTCPGTCMLHGEPGDPCGATENPPCAKGSYCHSGLCENDPQLGQSCTGVSFANAPGAPYCDLVTQTYVPLAREGEECTRTLGDTSGYPACEATFWCRGGETPPGTCQAYPDRIPPGQCVNDSQCSANEYCPDAPDDTEILRSCLPKVDHGAECTKDTQCPWGDGCAFNSTTGICEALAWPGATCATDGDCDMARCENGTCTLLAAMGEACTRDTQCASGTCQDGTCGDVTACL